MFGSFGWMELLLVLFIVLIVFGAGKIPQLGEGLGKAIKGFKKSMSDESADPASLKHQQDMADGGESVRGAPTGHSHEQQPSPHDQQHSRVAPPTQSEPVSRNE